MPLRILLTGHNGYLGSVLGPLLQACGHVVVGLDSGLYRDCTYGPYSPGISCVWKDVRDVDAELLRRFDTVINLAGIEVHGTDSVLPTVIDAINHRAALRLAKLARKAGCQRFILASSLDGYRHSNELEVLELGNDIFDVTILRLPELYGYSPRFRTDLPINRVAYEAFGTGICSMTGQDRLRAILHVEDAAAAFALATTQETQSVAGRTIDVAFAREVLSDRDIALLVEAEIPGARVEMPSEPCAPVARACDFVSVRMAIPACFPRWSPRTGIRQMIDAFDRFGGRRRIMRPVGSTERDGCEG